MKGVTRAHFNAVSESEALERVRTMRHVAMVQGYLLKPSKAAAGMLHIAGPVKSPAIVYKSHVFWYFDTRLQDKCLKAVVIRRSSESTVLS